jgi:hypothetical protein
MDVRNDFRCLIGKKKRIFWDKYDPHFHVVSVTNDKIWTGNWIYWTLTLVTTNNYDNLTELPTPKITLTTAHIKSPQSSQAVA